MRFDTRLRLAAVLALAASTAAFAQEQSPVPEHLLGMVGDWRLEQEDQTLPVCGLTFTEDVANGGWAVTIPEPCPPPFPPADAIVAWNVDEENGAVLLLDASQKVTLRLFEGEDGLFLTGEGVLPAFYLMLPWDDDGTGGEVGDEF